MNELQVYLQCRSDKQRLAVLKAKFALEAARELARRSESLLRNKPIDEALKEIAKVNPND